jgi:hypothetical protein
VYKTKTRLNKEQIKKGVIMASVKNNFMVQAITSKNNVPLELIKFAYVNKESIGKDNPCREVIRKIRNINKSKINLIPSFVFNNLKHKNQFFGGHKLLANFILNERNKIKHTRIRNKSTSETTLDKWIGDKRYYFSRTKDGIKLYHNGTASYLPLIEYIKVNRNSRFFNSLTVPSEKSIGIELEIVSKLNRLQLAMKLNEFNCKGVQITSDSSLRASGSYDYTHELRIVAPRSEYKERIIEICNALQDNSSANKSCGMHVHFDMRNVPWNDAILKGSKIAWFQSLLLKMQPVSRRSNTYCRRNSFNSYNGNIRNTGGRYYIVNAYNALSRHTTIEVRLHSGTIDSNKIINWISILDKLQNAEITRPSRVSEKIFKNIIGMELFNYYKARKTLFSSEQNEEQEAA